MVGRARRERTKSKRSLSRELAGAGAKEKAPPGGPPGRAQGRVPPGFLRGSLCPASSPGQARKLNWLGPRGSARRPRRAQPGTARVTEGQRAPQGQVGCQTRARFWGQTGGADCLTSVGLDLLVLKQSNDPSLPRRRCAPAGRGPGQRTPPRGSPAEAQTRGPTPPAARGRSPAEAPARRPLPHGRAGGGRLSPWRRSVRGLAVDGRPAGGPPGPRGTRVPVCAGSARRA